MREGWERVHLGDVMERRTETLGSTAEPTILTCTEGHGLVDQLAHLGRRAATENVRKYKRVEPLDIVYNVYLLWLGAIGQNLTGSLGITSPVYEVFRPNNKVHAPYLGHLLRSPSMVRRYASIAIGTVPRRRRTPWEEFLRLTVDLPPIDAQRRIVDLAGAVDEAIDLAAENTSQARSFLSLAQSAIPDGPELESSEVILAIEGGTSVAPVKGPVSGSPKRILKISAVRPALYVQSESKPMGPAPLPEKALVGEGDLLITRSNTPDRVGYVCVARDVQPQTYIPDLIWRLIPDESKLSADFLEHALSGPEMRERITSTASGTSQSMKKINRAGFGSVRIPVPPLEEQRAYIDRCQSAAAVVRESVGFGNALRSLRLELMAALLSGEHEIPSTYDEVMSAAI